MSTRKNTKLLKTFLFHSIKGHGNRIYICFFQFQYIYLKDIKIHLYEKNIFHRFAHHLQHVPILFPGNNSLFPDNISLTRSIRRLHFTEYGYDGYVLPSEQNRFRRADTRSGSSCKRDFYYNRHNFRNKHNIKHSNDSDTIM